MSSTLTPRCSKTASSVVAEVLADDADDADVGEEARREREVRRRAAEDPLALAERRLERVERDRADDGDRHAQTGSRLRDARPAAAAAQSALSVRSQVKS